MQVKPYKLSSKASPLTELPVFVISLVRSIERRRVVSKNLSGLGFSFKLLDACDGKQLSANEALLYSSKLARSQFGRDLTPGEIGCALSHIKVYEGMVEEQIRVALIMEDDAILSSSAKSAIEALLSSGHEWDLINLVSDSPERILTPTQKGSNFSLTRFEAGSNRTGAYLLKLEGAKKLLEFAYPVRLPADALTGSVVCESLVLRGLNPSIASLLPVPSTFQRGAFQPKRLEWSRKVPSPDDAELLILNPSLEPGIIWRTRSRVISGVIGWIRRVFR